MKTNRFLQQGGRFLRPESVGSSVFWYISVYEQKGTYGKDKGRTFVYMDGEVRLTDCENHINWNLSSEDDLEKIDVAIEQLLNCRNAFRMARSVFNQRKKKLKQTDDDE